MVTQSQYIEAKNVVSMYEEQQYKMKLNEVQISFPIGTHARSQSGWCNGVVYGYGRFKNDVTLKVRDSNGYAHHFLAKYATTK